MKLALDLILYLETFFGFSARPFKMGSTVMTDHFQASDSPLKLRNFPDLHQEQIHKV